MEGVEHGNGKVNDDLQMVVVHKTDVPTAQGTRMINEVGKAVKGNSVS